MNVVDGANAAGSRRARPHRQMTKNEIKPTSDRAMIVHWYATDGSRRTARSGAQQTSFSKNVSV